MAGDFREMLKPSLTERMAQDKLNTLDIMEKEQKAHPQPAPKAPEAPKEASTLLGKAVEFGWDKFAGEAPTDKDKAARAAKSDQYAEIAADTIASVPKIGTLVGGLTRATLLSDVSGNASPYDFSKKFALDLAQGAALNRVGKYAFASSEASVVTGTTIRNEMQTHFYSGAAFGGVKSAFNGDTYKDKDGNFSALATGTNMITGMGTGGLISMPAGYIGGRVGRATSVLLGSSAEQSLAASVLRSTVTGSSNGFANGATFGAIEAARHDFSFNSIMHGAMEGGAIGALTGGIVTGAEGFKAKTPVALAGPNESATSKVPAAITESQVANNVRATGPANLEMPNMPMLELPASPMATGGMRRAPAPEAIAQSRRQTVDQPLKSGEKNRDNPPPKLDTNFDQVAETSVKAGRGGRDRAPERSPEQKLHDVLYGDNATQLYESLSFKPFGKANIGETAGKLKQLPSESRSEHVLPDAMSTKHEDVVNLLKQRAKPGEEPELSDLLRAMDYKPVNFRVYEINGRDTRIAVPETYAKQLDEVRTLRREVETAQTEVAKAEAAKNLEQHPLKDRALPEDIVQMLEQLPQSDLITRIELRGEPGVADLYSRYKYDDPSFTAAARVGPKGEMTLMQPEMNSNLTTYITHELSHLTKWNSRANSRLFDSASSVDLVELNTNHTQTRMARRTEPRADDVETPDIYHPSEHATRSLDEGWAIGKGEELMNPDADRMSYYARKAPVRALVLSKAMADGANHTLAHGESPIAQTMLERSRILDAATRPVALKILQDRLTNGSAQQKSAAAELIGTFGNTAEHADVLLKTALEPRNNRALEVDGKPDLKTPSPREAAVEALVKLHSDSPAKNLDYAVQIAREHPELRAAAARAINKINDPRSAFYRRLLEFDGSQEGVNDLFKHLPNVKLSDQAGREMMYKEMMGAFSQNKSKQMEWSERVFEKVPSLRPAVMDHLQNMVVQGLNPSERQQLARYMQDVSTRVTGPDQERARRVLDGVNRFEQADAVKKAGSSAESSPESQLKAIEILAAEPGLKAMAPLVELASTGRPEVDVAAMRALAKHSPNVIKHYVHEAKLLHRNDHDKLERLNRLLNWRNFREAGIPEPGSR